MQKWKDFSYAKVKLLVKIALDTSLIYIRFGSLNGSFLIFTTTLNYHSFTCEDAELCYA